MLTRFLEMAVGSIDISAGGVFGGGKREQFALRIAARQILLRNAPERRVRRSLSNSGERKSAD